MLPSKGCQSLEIVANEALESITFMVQNSVSVLYKNYQNFPAARALYL